jgi:hypothetical protein
MGRTACTEPQCLYGRAIPLLPLWAVRSVQSLSACTVELYLYSPYGPSDLYRASVPVQGCTLPFSEIHSKHTNAFHEQNVEFLNFKPGRTKSNQVFECAISKVTRLYHMLVHLIFPFWLTQCICLFCIISSIDGYCLLKSRSPVCFGNEGAPSWPRGAKSIFTCIDKLVQIWFGNQMPIYASCFSCCLLNFNLNF